MKKINLSLEFLGPVFEKIEKTSKTQRILICSGAFLLLTGAFVYLFYLPKAQKIGALTKDYKNRVRQLTTAKRNAMQLERFRTDIKKAEKEYKMVMKALPDKQEIPSLLSSISDAGQTVGLEFFEFQPKPEISKDFFAEIPVSIVVSGSYHNVGLFFDRVAKLPRIVNIKGIKMSQKKGSDKLITTCTAVTYKFIETAPANPNATKTKKK
ncbi:MAG: type 4a pilus biogenesis protein PilO [Deltaproteobacteria bacterium]|nr:type 4a pilus biogenesis protein PilO [Deltaproteobacteria bacterium]